MCVNKKRTHTHSHQPGHDQRPPDVKAGCISRWQRPFVSKYIRRVSHFDWNTEDDGTAHMKLELKLWAGVVTSTKQIPLGRLTAILLVVVTTEHMVIFGWKEEVSSKTQNCHFNSCFALNTLWLTVRAAFFPLLLRCYLSFCSMLKRG